MIPTITWSSPDTLEWCFDGEPIGGIVATSAVGMFDTQEHIDWLVDGVREMISILRPVAILWKGKVPDALKAEYENVLICLLDSHVDKWRSVDNKPGKAV